jgi:hypothetical protein
MSLQGQSSRRGALLSLWRALVFLRFLPREVFADELGVRRLLESHPARSVKRYHRRFRANATILILGVPIFKREDVGAGCASVEIGASRDHTVTALQFAAGSKPERARGLNRLGLMREAVVEQDARLLKSSYAGFMTSSPEKSLDQGRRALSTAATEMPCTLGSAESGSGRTELSVRHFTVPGATRWTDTADILDAIGNNHEPGGGPGARQETSSFGPTATFLYAIHRAALEEAPSARRQFCHNGKLHELITQKQHFSPASSGAVGDRRTSVRMTGAIRDQSGAGIAEFSVWFDPADPSGIPNRIEFRARSFLRLTFESEPASTQAQAALPWLIEEERA